MLLLPGGAHVHPGVTSAACRCVLRGAWWAAGRQAEQRSKAASGQTPYFLKASDKRKLELVAKYEQLRKQGKLDRYMEKRRKHNASKDHRYLPSGRRDAGGGGDV